MALGYDSGSRQHFNVATQSTNVTVSTAGPNEVLICAFTTSLNTPAPVVSSPSLTWVGPRVSLNPGGGQTFQYEYSAVAAAQLTSEVITIDSGDPSCFYLEGAVWAISGADLVTKFDSGGSSNVPVSTATTNADLTITTNNSDTFIYAFYNSDPGVQPDSGSGWSAIWNPNVGGGFVCIEYKIISAAGSNVATLTRGGQNTYAGFGDAVKAAAVAPPATGPSNVLGLASAEW